MSLQNIKILVIDDDESTNFLTSYLFSTYYVDFKLYFELSAKAALKNLMENKDNLPDIILLDINMPEMNGWEFLNEYQKMGFSSLKKTAIFMLSSSKLETDKLKAKSFFEVVEYIEKPLSEEKIQEIKEILQV
ncbi:MAG: hypothetical protein A2046_02470 [Bacteroidetes bacterium GWA2_30_7]|nr:MAG: hypothetical protein A2046_02470 [Bacteroidetes bacterium GWA2_30_7]